VQRGTGPGLAFPRSVVTFHGEQSEGNAPMTEEYTPPRVWTWEKENGGQWASLNRPIAGATHDKELPTGEHPFQLYSLATPNGQKVTILFEELLAAGHAAERLTPLVTGTRPPHILARASASSSSAWRARMWEKALLDR